MDAHAIELDESWELGGKAHGGYLLASMVGLALDEDHPHPMAVSAHYVTSPHAGTATVAVERLRTGRQVASSRLRMTQDDAVRVELLLTSGRYAADATPYWSSSSTAAPVLPPVEECPRAPTMVNRVRIGHLDHVEMRVESSTMMWAAGAPAGVADYRAYLRRDDGNDPSVLDLLVFADTLPPITFDLGLKGWVPTVELTVLIRALPAPGWVTATQRGRLLQDGWLDEECELWDSEGRLVAQARQLAGYRVARDDHD